MDIIILLGLIFLNGLFVMSEIALVSARKARLESMAEKGDKKAETALNLSYSPEIFLSAAQIGITLIAIITGVYSGERFSIYLQPLVEKVDAFKPYAETIATTLVVMVVTFLSIVFGELIPKRIGLTSAEKIARIMATPMLVFSKITHPIVWLLNITSNSFFKLFNIKSSKDDTVTEDEIKAIISEGTEAGTIEEEEKEMIERIFHLGDRNITSLMTHRSDIVWFDINDNEEKIKEKIMSEPHSVYPICDGEIDNIKGVVSIKDLYVADDMTLFKNLMHQALFVPENNTAYQVMEKFKESKIHSCFIVDEYGSLQGMITLNDILEAIVGNIPQTESLDYEIVEREDGSFLVDAQIPFYDFLSRFEKQEWVNESVHEYDTLAGCILYELERIPQPGDKMQWKGFTFEIMDMDGHRIDKVLVTASPEILDEMEEE
ncbi:hemolysin family protein [Chitinophagaceae bacterium LB-8]|uniref:Hemolysin family protein n=1 Tax=Paraflavisolibacter caeni TaxID=2982496 RepID=A0A9X3B6C3_9BACT|nr:hemolysin family protein [Paraflavisolibacter caeni]MCU7547805.1 hemolysin family protein [Paraflavisolibacter caeni]